MKFKSYIYIFFLLSFIVLYSSEIKYTADSMKISFDENGEIDKVYLEGNIEIFYKDIVFKAEKALLDIKNNQIECEGNIKIISDKDEFYADYMKYDMLEETGTIYNAKFKFEPFFGKAEKLERKGEMLKMENGYLTTCDLEKPHYRISAGKIEFLKNNYLKGEKFKIVVGEKFNIFYFPKFMIDLETKKPFFIPSVSYKTRTGILVGLTLNFKITEKKDYLLSEDFLIGIKGGGIGLGFSSQKNNVNFKSFLLKRWNESGIQPGGYLEVNKNFENLDFFIDWRWMYDNEFFVDFFRDEFMKKSKMYNYFSLTGDIGKGIMSLTVRENAKEDILKVEKLPEIRYFLPYFQFSSIPLFFSYDFRLTNFYKEEKNYIRFLNKIDLMSKKDFGYFTLRPYISFSTLDYESSDFDRFNYIGEGGLSLSTLFYSNFLNKDIIFIPDLSIFSRWVKYEPSSLIQFDDFEEKKGGNFLSLNLRWDINAKDGLSGNFEIENVYDVGKNKFENLFFRYGIGKGSLKIEGENEWDNENSYKFGINSISYEKEGYKFSIGTRVDKDAEMWGLETWWEQSLKNDWNYRIGLFYDFDSKELLTQSYEIWRKIHCLTFDFRVTKDRENFSFYVFIVPSIFFENNWQRRFIKWK